MGKISKQWSGFAREAFTDSDHFGINFPMDLDVRVKATLLGALFLIVSVEFFPPKLDAIIILIFLFRIICSLKKLATRKLTVRECFK